MLRFKLRKYQQIVFDWLLPRNKGCLFLRMRLGKTLILIRKVKTLMDTHENRVLIIAPLGAFDSWIADLKQEGFSCFQIWHSVKKKRLQSYIVNRHKYQFFIINKEIDRVFPALASEPWTAVIIDESHFIKDPKAKITKFILSSFHHVPYRFCATGTPKGKNDMDYFNQLKFTMDELKNTNYYSFRNRCFKCFGFKWVLTPKGRKHLFSLLKMGSFSLTREEAGVGKVTKEIIREIAMPASSLKVYNGLITRWCLTIQGEDVKRNKWILEQFTLLRRLCGGFAGDELIHKAKVNEIKYLLETELKDEKVVIWARYRDEITLLYDELLEANYKVTFINGDIKGQKRQNRKLSFQRGDCQVLICQPATMKEGVDLSAADTAIYYSMPDGDITFNQTRDRILSIKKQGDLFIIYLCMKDTIDRDIIDGVRSQKRMNDIMFYTLHKQRELRVL